MPTPIDKPEPAELVLLWLRKIRCQRVSMRTLKFKAVTYYLHLEEDQQLEEITIRVAQALTMIGVPVADAKDYNRGRLLSQKVEVTAYYNVSTKARFVSIHNLTPAMMAPVLQDPT